MRNAALALGLLCASVLPAQRVQVYSEFRRIGPDGDIVEQDRPGTPREIISPEVPRNAFTTFRLVLKPPPGKQFSLFLGQNPEGVFQVSLYRETQTKVGTRPLPDRLEKVTLPETGVLAPDVNAATYLLDVWVPATAPERKRIRIEAQLNIGEEWVIYPMEFRVGSAIVPKHEPAGGMLPVLTAMSALPAFTTLQTYLCGGKPERGAPSPGLTARELIRRNAAQDVAVASALEPALGKEALQTSILSQLGAADAKTWCAARTPPGPDPELYLKVREQLLRSMAK